MNVIGLMSGTSADGIDAALVAFDGDAFRLVAFCKNLYPDDIRKRILAISSPRESRLEEVARLDFLLGEFFAKAAHAAANAGGMRMDQIDLIGSHGQTILHLPEALSEGDYLVRATMQIAEPSVIAERTGVTTVADFRPRDIAAGGQGAPLTPYVHYILLHHPTDTRAVLNLGGISNITFIPAGSGPEEVTAFDVGPGNMVLDGLVERITRGAERMDTDGARATRGRPDGKLLQELLDDPYFDNPPPKTTGRERFGAPLIDEMMLRARKRSISDDDLLATAVSLTTRSVGIAVRKFLLPKGKLAELVVCGGGAHNKAMMEGLALEFPEAKVTRFESHGLSGEAVEAVTFAVLARLAVLGRSNNLPAATGAEHPVVMGKIVPGRDGIRSFG